MRPEGDRNRYHFTVAVLLATVLLLAGGRPVETGTIQEGLYRSAALRGSVMWSAHARAWLAMVLGHLAAPTNP